MTISSSAMRFNRLGRSELTVSALALGTVELGLDYGIAAPGDFGRPPVEAAIRLVHAAIDAGFTLIDTARAYGSSEEVLGQALAGRRGQVILATKIVTQAPGGVPRRGAELRRHMLDSLATSLAALRTDYVDLWQIHNVDQHVLDEAEAIASVFAEARAAGMVRSVGGSFYGPDLPLAALEYDLFDVMQITYSVLDQRVADRLLPAAARQDVGIMARSVLLKGALTERAEHLPDHLHSLRLRSRAYRELVAAACPDATPAQAAIAFALTEPAIHTVLIGVRTEAELRANLAALTVDLSAATRSQLASLRLDNADLLNPGTWGIP
jgi:aryl-alcohol dehydrogenase-like predicted oxidoreductase